MDCNFLNYNSKYVGVSCDYFVTDNEERVLSVESFEEKPLQSFYVGHMILDSSVLDNLPNRLIEMPDGEGLVELFSCLSSSRSLLSVPYDGAQITFNTQQELSQAEHDIVTFFTQPEDAKCP